MPDPTMPRPARPLDSLAPAFARGTPPVGATPPGADASRSPASDKTLCDRCGAEMYRMHAVWRCPACGFKTDCCGW